MNGPNLSSQAASYNVHSQGNSTISYQSGVGPAATWIHNKKGKKQRKQTKSTLKRNKNPATLFQKS